jgi:hypothetical protein
MHIYPRMFFNSFWRMNTEVARLSSLWELRKAMRKKTFPAVFYIFSWVFSMLTVMLLPSMWTLRGPPEF